eukprot:1159673-Pelagomonas_calceolata.AAC.2
MCPCSISSSSSSSSSSRSRIISSTCAPCCPCEHAVGLPAGAQGGQQQETAAAAHAPVAVHASIAVMLGSADGGHRATAAALAPMAAHASTTALQQQRSQHQRYGASISPVLFSLPQLPAPLNGIKLREEADDAYRIFTQAAASTIKAKSGPWTSIASAVDLRSKLSPTLLGA